MVRSPFDEDPGRASDVFVTLGMLAEERGTDSAGLALLGAWPGLGGRPGIVPIISGRAWVTGTRQLMLDPSDPFPGGYRLSDTWPMPKG